MTIQDASHRLFNIQQYVANNDYFSLEDVEALDMAWNALVEGSETEEQ